MGCGGRDGLDMMGKYVVSFLHGVCKKEGERIVNVVNVKVGFLCWEFVYFLG